MKIKREKPDYASIEDRRKGPIVDGYSKEDRQDTQRVNDSLKVAREDKAAVLREKAAIRSAVKALRKMGHDAKEKILIGGAIAKHKRKKK